MRGSAASILGMVVAVACGPGVCLPGELAKPRLIFDGRSLAGWEGDQRHWRIEDAAITGSIPDGGRLAANQFIWWRDEVGDFELELEYRIAGGPTANSGIQYRSVRLPDGHARGYQADLDDGTTWLGRIYDEHGRGLLVERGTRLAIAPDGRKWADTFAAPDAVARVVRKGDWNRYRIRATAAHVTVWINDTLAAVLDDRDAKDAELSGRLALQLHSGAGPARVQFRDIRLTTLGTNASPPRAAATPGESATAPTGSAPAGIRPTRADGSPFDLGFEGGSLAGWTATGDAFAGLPCERDSVSKRRFGDASNAAGRFWVGTYEPKRSDDTRGTLASDAFPVTHPWASFLVGGGSHVGTRVELIDEESGAVFHAARGGNVERMRREVVDLTSRVGKAIRIRLVDDHAGGWGHVNFDDFVFHAAKPVFPAEGGGPGGGGRDGSSPVLWHTVANQPAKPGGTHAAATNEPAAASVAGMKVTPGFRVDLVAAEPDIHQPIAFAIDPRGRLWVVEGHSYPTKRPEGQGLDRIVILADQDGDGSFEARKVFKEGLNLASGIELGFGGVFVGAAPHLLFLADRDGDDLPDGEPEILLDGWGYQDTHETLNSFTWGPDGWLYGCHGVFTSSHVGPPGTPPGQRQRINGGIWRYHPVRNQFEIFAQGGSNQWGVDFSSVGDAFMTHCRSFFGGGGTTHILRNGIFWNQANAGYPAFVCSTAPAFAPDLKNYLPAAARYDSGEGGAGKPGTNAVYGGHSHVGTMVYLGDNWPEIYRDRIFTHNLHGRQLNHQEAVRQGSGYEVFHAGHDILHVPDETYVAVDLQYGPDGAVYVIDWSDRQHCHNPATEAWDRTNGRLYRVAWAETFRSLAVDLFRKTDQELVALHTHRNEWFVRTARRLLQERAVAGTLDRAVLEPLVGMASSPDAVTALRGLWTLHVTGALDGAGLARAFAHADDRVRGWAVALATEVPGTPLIPTEALLAAAEKDPSALVRRSLASALPALPPADRWTIAAALATHGEDAGDRFLPKLIWSGIAPLVEADLPRAAALAATTPIGPLADSISWYLGRLPEGRRLLVAALVKEPPAVAARRLEILDFSLANLGAVPEPEGWSAVVARCADGNPSPATRRLSAVFGDAGALAALRATLADRGKARADREEALAVLARVGDREAVPIFVALLDDPEFRSAAVPLVSRSTDPAVATRLLAAYPSLDEKDRGATLATLVSKPDFARRLVEAIEARRFPKDDVAAAHLRQLRGLDDPEIRAALDRVYGKVNESPAAAKATMARLKTVWDGAPKWAIDRERGRAVFAKACASCHMHGDVGRAVGPSLSGSWINGAHYFIENVVDPNAVVGPDYQLTTVATDDGRSIIGIVAEETPESLVLRTPEGPVTIAKPDIEERKTASVSLMPSGILEQLPEDELLALLAFLTAKP